MVLRCLSLIITSSLWPLTPTPPPAPSSSSVSRSSLFLDLEDEQAQVDVFGGQQFVALHRVGDGQRDVVGLVGVVAEGVVVDNRLDPHIVVGALQQQEGALQGRVYLWRHIQVKAGGRLQLVSSKYYSENSSENLWTLISRLARISNFKVSLTYTFIIRNAHGLFYYLKFSSP